MTSPHNPPLPARRGRRLLAVSAAAIVVTATLSSCGASGSTDGSTTLEFQTAQSADSPLLAALTTATDEFEKQNPGITVDLKTAGNDYESQIKVRLAANNPPDLWATHGWSLDRYSSFLAPLQDESWAKDFDPALDPAMKNDKGEFFALPVDTAVSGLIVNETVLEKAGVSADSLTDWDSFMAAADKVAQSGSTPFFLAGSKDGSAGNLVDWLAPGAFDDDQLESFTDGKFPKPAYEKVLGVLDDFQSKGWVNADYSSATGDDMAKSLGQDRSAFALSSNPLVTQAKGYAPEARLQFVPVPALGGGDPYLIGGEDIAFGAAKNGAHLAEAKKYLAFLAGPDVAKALAESTGNPSGLTNVKADLGTLEPSYAAYVTPKQYALEPYFDRVYLPNGMWNTVVTTADSVLAGQASPASATDKVASDFSTLYK